MAPLSPGVNPRTNFYSILLADDHEMFRREVRKIIEETAGLKVVGEVGDGQELFEIIKKCAPNLVILDISMPNLRGLEATRQIKMEHPGVKVLILIMDWAQEYLAQAAAAGAEGCILKQETGNTLPAAIETIRQGGSFLPSFS